MRFEFGGKTYFLEFQREHRDITTIHNGTAKTVKSTYPYTTARLLLQSAEPLKTPHDEVAKATVGCMPGDKYSNAAGRLFALRALTSRLRRMAERFGGYDREFREAMWKAYVERGKQKNPSNKEILEHNSAAEVIEGTVVRRAEGPQQPLTVADQNGLDERVIH